MIFKLENPRHQTIAIRSAVEIFRGMERNTYDNAHQEDIHTNTCSLSAQELAANILRIVEENLVPNAQAHFADSNDACIEMETGTGKTLTYIQTAYELFKEYGLTKFIILVPYVPIRQGVIDTIESFRAQLADKYDIQPNAFIYDSSKLSLLHDFLTSDNLQFMVMTMASFNSEDKILNQVEREGLFNNLSYLAAIAQTHPIIFMDEPQEGMDTDNSKQWIARLNPLFKFRYSATHAVKMNVLYQLTTQAEYIKNPPVFMEQAAFRIRQVQLDELVRCAEYQPTENTMPFNFEDFTKDGCDNYVSTPNHGAWDKTLYDSTIERTFAEKADSATNTDVVCFLKFPTWYKIPTPIGDYEPDFGVVLRRKQLLGNQDEKEYYFVVEIKGTEDITDIRALTPHERARMECAFKHFRALGIEAHYKAPIKEYDTFKAKAVETINSENNGNL